MTTRLGMVLGLGLVMFAGTSSALAAGEQPSRDVLADMGLAGLSVMSDEDAMAVRGFGFKGASAWGNSWARVSTPHGSAGSTNGYKAEGRHEAKGSNLSFAGFVSVNSGGKGGHGGGAQNGTRPPKNNVPAAQAARNGGGYGGGGNHGGGGHGGGHGGKPQIKVFAVFSGGASFAKSK